MSETLAIPVRSGRMAAASEPPDTRRLLQLVLAGLWLLDAVLQYQSFMFTKNFSDMLAGMSDGNPGLIASPITWNANLVAHHLTPLNGAFATIQLAIGLAIAWRPVVRYGLAASIVWSLGVWWSGDGLGMILTGRRVGAAEGRDLGFVHDVVPQAELMDAARTLAGQILELSPMSVRASKQAVYRGLDEASLAAAIKGQFRYPAVSSMFKSADFVEGPMAFAQKRMPQWKGQ